MYIYIAKYLTGEKYSLYPSSVVFFALTGHRIIMTISQRVVFVFHKSLPF